MNNYFDTFYDWWKNIDKSLFFLVATFFILGLFFSFVSTSIIASDKLNTNSYYFFFKHLVFVCLGISIILIFSILNQEFLVKISIFLFFITFASLFLVPLIGVEIKGSRRWLDIGALPRFQPIETVKPFFIIIISFILSLDRKNLYFKYFLSTFVLIPTIILLLSQPDLGQTLLISSVWLVIIFVSGINLFIFSISLLAISFVTFFLVFFVSRFEYIKIRIMAFLNTSGGNNYQADKASDAISSGGFFGKGIGEGTLNSRIPEAHTDYIISVVAEEFGVIIVVFIILLYLFFSYRVIKKINSIDNSNFKLILIGCITIILVQMFIHVGVNIRILPTTGMTMPFISYGGSSIIGTSIITGIILNLTKRKIV
ncbi:FtsW/RodA/SpoVE family cell cycle protein [Candidatus Pelagibacter sp.]|nr:FtsW/RodA/SpoVE family cell cycle protein [Candidatus Pelagibacter sp.]